MKKIGILTRDCAGINAAIRAVVRTACYYNMEILGIRRGYEGLANGELVKLDRLSVSGILNRGGTILKTARSKKFRTEAGQEQAVQTLKENNIEGLTPLTASLKRSALKSTWPHNFKILFMNIFLSQ